MLLRRGLLVTVSSDDPAYFGGYVADNLRESAATLGLTDDEVLQLARNSFLASFLDDAARARHLADIDAIRG
jgi:adenosine deaminase